MNDKTYPQEVEILKKLTSASEIKETHISYALIGDEFVYKTKKPVDFGFLDYRLPKSRRGFCILEKDLNSRFSKGIYLEVLKLVKKSHDEFMLVPVESTLTAVEYVLKMKKIKDEDFLQNRVTTGQVDAAKMMSVGHEVGLLFKGLENAPKDNNFNDFFEAVKFNAVENFNQTEKYVGSLIDKDGFNFVQKKTLEFLESHSSLFNKRENDGYVKNGHGDLRLEHIYFNEDGSVGLIDCIEFNKRFRFADAVAEAAFLSMELDFAGMSEHADSFLEGFFQVFNDSDSITLLNYYRCYFSYVRAKVTCFLVEGKDGGWELFDVKVAEIKRLIDMSVFYCANLTKIENILFYGLMGTGKSKNAKVFADMVPIFRINSDEERKKMVGVPQDEKCYLNWDTGIYSLENSLKLYNYLGAETAKKNAIGRPCVVDASFAKKDFLSKFKEGLKSDNLFYVKFTASDDLIKERLDSRLTRKQATDGRFAIFEKQRNEATMPDENLLIDSSAEISSNTEKIFKKAVEKI